MKKQILLFVLFVVTTFASVSKSYGQTTCTPGALNPSAGVAYDYEVTVTAGSGTSPVYVWYVTQATDLIGGAKLTQGADFTVGTDSGFSTYSSTTSTSSKIKLTWNAAALANGNPYYLVVKYSETSTAGCSVENMKVWQIKPVNSFLLAIAGSDVAGATANASSCAPAITAATVTPATPTVSYDYGQSSIYYKVTASGVAGTWTPTINLPALAGAASGQVYVSADWGTLGATPTWNSFGTIVAAGGNMTSSVAAPVSVVGTDILVRIVINNSKYEGTTAQTVTVGIDGELPGGIKDIKGGGDCADETTNKTGTHTILVRPAIAPGAAGAFIAAN